MIPTIDNQEHYLACFENLEKCLNGNLRSDIHTIRRAGVEQFAQLGFPTNKNEEWRFTNIAPIVRTQFIPIHQKKVIGLTKKDIMSQLIQGLTLTTLVFVDGQYSQALSEVKLLSKKVIVQNLNSQFDINSDIINQHLNQYASYDKNAFTALNTGFIQDGAFIIIPDNTVIDSPIYLVFLSTQYDQPVSNQPRNLFVIGKNCKLSIIEHYLSTSDYLYLTNSLTEIAIGENSTVEHTKIQNESMKGFHIGSTYVRQSAGSNFTSNSIMIGGLLARNHIHSILDGEGIECTLNGLSLATDQQLIDNYTIIDHVKPRCNSYELYKAILDKKSKGVFNGKIYVRKDAQKTDAKQTNKTLLLSDDATMNTKPQLEIFADDVKCTHGATVGYLDADAIFYLRSRGIEVDMARDILTNAFASDVINRISSKQIRDHLNYILLTRLKQS